MSFGLVVVVWLACAPKVGVSAGPEALPSAGAVVAPLEPAELLRQVSVDGEPGGRARAVRTLAAFDPGVGGREAAERGLADDDPWVQRAAVDGLAARRAEPAARGRLLAVLADAHADPYVRAHVVAVLLPAADAAERQALASLLDVALATERAGWRRTPLLWARARLGDAAASAELARRIAAGEVAMDLEFLAEVPAGPDPVLAAAFGAGAVAVEELALPFHAVQLALGDPGGEVALRRLLVEGGVEARLEVLDLLAPLPGSAVVGLIRKAADDEDELVRGYARVLLAVRGLGDVGDVERAAASADRDLRVVAVRWVGAADPVLGRRVERISRRIVRVALGDVDAEVRAAALIAAPTVLGVEDLARLRAALVDDSPPVRVAAAEAVIRLTRAPSAAPDR